MLRGIFTLRRAELLWYYQEGASWMFPDKWERFLEPIPEDERGDLMAAYHRRLTPSGSGCPAGGRAAPGAFGRARPSRFCRTQEFTDQFGDAHYALAFARIENHYFVNEGFFEEGQLIRDAHRLRDIPGVIIQGRYDVATPAVTAWDLHKAWPEAEFIMVPDAGHAFTEPGILHHLIESTDRVRQV